MNRVHSYNDDQAQVQVVLGRINAGLLTGCRFMNKSCGSVLYMLLCRHYNQLLTKGVNDDIYANLWRVWGEGVALLLHHHA